MPINLLLAAAPALASGLFGAVKGVQALNQSKKIKPDYYSLDDPRLTGMASEFAKQRLGLAQMQLNAQDPFAAAQQRGILGSQAGAMASAQRAVTDPAQALAMTAAIQGNTNQSLAQQGLQNQQNYQQRLANLTGAQEGMIQERDKAFQERMNKFLMDQQRKDALQQAGVQSLINAGSSLSSSLLGMRGAQVGASNMKSLSKGFSNLAAPAMSRTVTQSDYGENPFGNANN